MPVEHDVERAGVRRRLHAHEAAGVALRDARAEPGLVGEHGALLGVAGTRLVQGLERDQFLRRHIARLVEPVHAVVGHHRRDRVVVDLVAGALCAERRQHGQARDFVFESARVQAEHAHDQGGRVVACARGEGGLDQRFAGLLGAAGGRQRRQPGGLEHAVHAVAGEQEAVADPCLALEVIDAQHIVQADGAGEPAALVGVAERVILGEQLQLAACEAPQTCVAHVRHGKTLALQHQRGQRRERRLGRRRTLARQALALAVLRQQPAVLRADQAVERDGGLPGGGRGEEVAEQAHHGGLRRLQPAATARDAVGDGGDQAARGVAGAGSHGAGEVFVGGARAAPAGVPDVDVKAHDPIVARVSAPTLHPRHRSKQPS